MEVNIAFSSQMLRFTFGHICWSSIAFKWKGLDLTYTVFYSNNFFSFLKTLLTIGIYTYLIEEREFL